MKKLLIIANIRKHQGGITTQVLELAESLKQEGIPVEIVSTHGSVKERLSGILKAYSSAGDCGLIISVGCSYYGFFPVIVASSIAGLRGKKIIHNFHDGQVDEFLRKYLGIAKLFIGSGLIVVATDYLKKSFDKFGFNTIKISNHYNVISDNTDKRIKFKKLKVIWARSFEKLYDPETAIEAALHFRDNPDIEFHFYGTGKYLEYYKEKYANEGINFLGYVSREELLKKYPDYDIFMNTSLYDNFPMSIIEAGINRLIVISSKAGGIPTIYGENEILFYEPGNKEDLVARIKNVLGNRDIYSSYAERLHNRVISFTWDYVKEDWMRLIKDNLKESGQ